jgi:hypothetical protein
MPWQDGRSEYLPAGAGRYMPIIYKATYMEDRGKVLKVAERAEQRRTNSNITP